MSAHSLGLQDAYKIKEAEEYIGTHKINELFQDLCTNLCVIQPENITEYLIEQLKLRKKQGAKFTIYTSSEITNIFTLFDLRGEGFITRQQAKKALGILAHSEFHFTQVEEEMLEDKIYSADFVRLCEKILGIKPTD